MAPSSEVGAGRYSVSYSPGAQELSVSAVFPAGTPSLFAVEPGSGAWLADVEVRTRDAFARAKVRDDGVEVPCARGCELRYRYALGAAGRARLDIDTASTHGDLVVAPPSTWLLAPVGGGDGGRLAFSVSAPEPARFVSGLPSLGGLHTVTVGALRRSPYALFGPSQLIDVDEGDVHFSLALPTRRRHPAPELFVSWIRASARAVRGVLGAFPARHAALIVLIQPGSDVDFGVSLAGSSIVLYVGADTPREAFAEDWVLTHEMLHFAFPAQPDARDWSEEGLATYVEPFARVRAGLLREESAWEGLVRGFRFGQPQPGDEGLDRTRTWGRVYWGGTLFYFEADCRIRERTGDKKGLSDALSAIVREGGTNGADWSVEKAFAVGDRGTGMPVLTELLARHGSRPVPFDYEARLEELGVKVDAQGKVRLDEDARRAGTRRAMVGRGRE